MKTVASAGDRSMEDCCASSRRQKRQSLEAQIALLDAKGRIILVNRAWKRVARRHRCFCIAHADLGANYLEACRRAGSHGAEILAGIQSVLDGSRESFSHEFACASAKEQRWFRLSVTPIAGRDRGVVLSRNDITEQQHADAARAQLAAIVESSTDAIVATTLDGMVTNWNKGAEHIYGHTAAEIVGHPIRWMVPRNRRQQLDQVIEKLKRGERVEPFETVRRRKDGRLIPVALTISAIKDASGTIVGASGIARDISDWRELEAEVLRASEREQRRIAQDLHDGLGQQVAGVACLADVLQSNLVAEHSPHTAMATKIGTLLKDATAQTRSLAHGLFPVPPGPRGLMAALDALAARTSELFRVDCTFEHTRTVRVADNHAANHLYRIAQEAVTNAVRHARPRHIEIRLWASRTQIILGVRDDGVGIRPRRRRKGIGLRIMNYRANLISGTLLVQHAPGGGTEIICTVDRRSHDHTDQTRES